MTDDSANTAPPLHPSLQQLDTVHRRRLRLLSMLLFLLMAGFMLFGMVIAFTTSQSIGSLLLLGLIGVVMLPVMMGLSGLLGYLDRALSRTLDTANHLLRECTPQPVRLTPLERAGRDGVLATLHPLTGKLGQTEPLHALINPSYRWGPPPRQEIEVRLYCQELMPGGGLVALQPDGVPLLGKIVDRSGYERQKRVLRGVAVVLLLVIIVALAVRILGGLGA